MAAPELTNSTRTLSLLSLPVEVRHIIYDRVFSKRSIIVRDKLNPPDAYVCGRQYWHFRLSNPQHTTDSSIPLLQVCKQVLTEAQPLLLRHVPSHLVLSKDLHNLPSSRYHNLGELGVPLEHITHLTFHIKILGENKNAPRKCPGLSGSTFSSINCSWTEDCFDVIDAPPPEPQRLPNLGKIHQLSRFVNSLAALREVHIYNTLKHHLSQPLDQCTCPIAGSESCSCGKCQCDCVTYPPLLRSETAPLAGTETELREGLLSYFRTALPTKTLSYYKPFSDYHAVLSILRHGVRVFLHDEIKITMPLDTHRVLHKGVWHAMYCLAPPKDAKLPKNPPTEAVEAPRQWKSRQANEGMAEGKSGSEEGRGRKAVDGVLPSFDFDSFLKDDFSFLKDDESGDEDGTNLMGGLVERPLVEFEAGLHLKIVNKADFGKVVDRNATETQPDEIYEDLWKWD